MQTQAAGIMGIMPLILIFVVFYFLVIMPQKKQQRKHAEMIKNIKKNDEIVTIGGIHGTVVNIKEKTFVIRIDDNAKIEIDKTAVASVI